MPLKSTATKGYNPAAASHAIEDASPMESWPGVDPSDQITTEISSPKAKSGRLLDRPIVIVEPQTTTLTPEYYRQLFDSFSGGHYSRVEAKVAASSDKNLLKAKKKWRLSSTAASTVASVAAGTESHLAAPVTDKSATNESEESDHFSMSPRQLMNLLPKTWRVNLIAVRRVLIDCYTPNRTSHDESSSVNCFKKITFQFLDKAIESDVVELTDMVSLVNDNKTTNGQSR